MQKRRREAMTKLEVDLRIADMKEFKELINNANDLIEQI